MANPLPRERRRDHSPPVLATPPSPRASSTGQAIPSSARYSTCIARSSQPIWPWCKDRSVNLDLMLLTSFPGIIFVRSRWFTPQFYKQTLLRGCFRRIWVQLFSNHIAALCGNWAERSSSAKK